MPWILRVATGARTLAAVGIWLVGTSLLFGTGPYPRVGALAPGGMLPEEQLWYTPEMLMSFLGAIGPEGRADYILFQRLDILTPLLLGGAAALVIAWLVKRAGRGKGWAARLPYVPVLFLLTEIAEDYVLARAAQLYPEVSAPSAALPVLTAAKFAVMFLLGAIVILYGFRPRAREELPGSAGEPPGSTGDLPGRAEALPGSAGDPRGHVEESPRGAGEAEPGAARQSPPPGDDS